MTKKTPKTAPPDDKTKTLRVPESSGQTRDQMLAKLLVHGEGSNAFTAVNFSKGTFGEVSLTDCWDAMSTAVKKVHGGDLSAAETLLTSQAIALNAMFGELSRRAMMNMGEHLGATESYLRLALKAQGQCRATLETLAAIKNPPVVFARQANIAHGPQQINNGTTAPPTHATQPTTPKTEVLEAQHGEWLDTGAASTTGRADPQLAPVGQSHRPENT